MIRVEIELSSPDMSPLDAAVWIARTLNETLPGFAVVHRLDVEQVEA